MSKTDPLIAKSLNDHSYEDIRRAWRDANLHPLWESAVAHKLRDGGAAPNHRKWKQIRPLVDEAMVVASPAAIERRVLTFADPNRAGSTTTNLTTALQILLPGERARPHRHTMNALRFVIEGKWRIDDRRRQRLSDGNGRPGDHAGLDLARARSPGQCAQAPSFSPVFRYPWAAARNAVRAAPKWKDGSRRVRYVNPVTGGSTMPLMDCYLIQIDKGSETVRFRTTSNAVCLVCEGRGASQIGADTLTWDTHDVFSLPHGNWITHTADETATLFLVTDRDALH